MEVFRKLVPSSKLPEPKNYISEHLQEVAEHAAPCEALEEVPAIFSETLLEPEADAVFFVENQMEDQDQEADVALISGPSLSPTPRCFQISTPTASDAHRHFIGTPTAEDVGIKDDAVDGCMECDEIDWFPVEPVGTHDTDADCDDGCAAVNALAAVLDNLRKHVAMQFLTAAKGDQLQAALQDATNPARTQPVQQTEQGQKIPAPLTDSDANGSVQDPSCEDLSVFDRLRKQAAFRFLTAAKCGLLQAAFKEVALAAAEQPAQKTEGSIICNVADTAEVEEGSLLQQLRLRTLFGMAAAARAGNLGSILQTASSAPPLDATHATTQTPKLPSSLSVSYTSQGGCDTPGHTKIAGPTDVPRDFVEIRMPEGRPSFRRTPPQRRPSNTDFKLQNSWVAQAGCPQVPEMESKRSRQSIP